ncbi:MAG: TIGR04283 family arsenosugar biosynthesis glycosyltransferase [Planctomycetales bacterium]|nr:TIGR04283 family arsenosugar biosynthesis glycosyltransferase [Planctomycetales bacterium]
MRVSVVIPAVNEAAHIARAVGAALQAGADEVIVADGGSEDQTADVARAAGATVVASPRVRANQQSVGAATASGDVLLFQHADNWCGPQSVTQIKAAVQRCGVRCGAFRQRIAASGFAYRVLEWGNAWRARWLGLPYGDQGLFVCAEQFHAAGGFPEVPLMEDLLLMRRLRKTMRPALLPGPHYVSARRWQKHGVARQTLRNWWLLSAFACGMPLARLAGHYAAHDKANVD